MKAILSDIHGNLEALQAVLEDAARHGADAIYCLGDLVGYGGPNPRECVDLAMDWQVVLAGNHEQAVFFDPTEYNPTARGAMLWAARQLHVPIPDRSSAQRRWVFLAGLRHLHEEGDLLFLHGSPRKPLWDYVFPSDNYNVVKMQQIFAEVRRRCFNGHTHWPGIFTEDGRFIPPKEIDGVYRLDNQKTLVNVGSVGQPRDGDWRACYVLLDEETVRFRRVEYDVDTTVRKIHGIAELDYLLKDRLRQGW
jgi:predicted phosphodiesterase